MKRFLRVCFSVTASFAFAFFFIEAAANHYLWNLATKDKFNELASINQLKERYGDDFISNSGEARRDLRFVP